MCNYKVWKVKQGENNASKWIQYQIQSQWKVILQENCLIDFLEGATLDRGSSVENKEDLLAVMVQIIREMWTYSFQELVADMEELAPS